jgi:hypothetical protein
MRHYTNIDTDELYDRIRMLANEASGFDLDEQDYYVNEIRCILNELDQRIAESITLD